MGWKDIFSNASEWEPDDLMNGGILGASLMAQARRMAKESSERQKPGKFCNKVCSIDDERCTSCLALQEELEYQLTLLEQMEDASELNSSRVQKKAVTKCALCGAPYETGSRECPYCGTAYSMDQIVYGFPSSGHERQEQLMKQAEATWAVYLKLYVLKNQYLQNAAGNDMIGHLQKFFGKAGNVLQSWMNLNAGEIKQGARYYGVKMSQYIYGVMMGEMKTIKLIRMEEQNKQMHKNSTTMNDL